MPERYAPMIARARGFRPSASWGRIILALVILWFGFQILFSALFTLWMNSPGTSTDAVDAFLDGASPSGVRWTLASFGLYWMLLALILRSFHGAGLWALIGPPRAALSQFKRVCLYLLPFYALFVLPSLADPAVWQQFTLAAWLPIALSVLPPLLLQVGAEELIFRGYLQSHLAALARWPVIWMGLPSLLFGLIHFDGMAPAQSAWAYVAWAVGLGLICADLTARSGTLGPALALHLVNNTAAILVLASDEWLYGAALFVWPTYGEPWQPLILQEALVLLILWLATRLALRR